MVIYNKLYYRGGFFSMLSISLLYPKESFTSNFKQLGREDFKLLCQALSGDFQHLCVQEISSTCVAKCTRKYC